ncbi:hypothetical protein FI667_g345, partial [Globisporangium splendens]
MDEERTLDDVWTWKGNTTNWIQDFGNGTAAADYMTPLSSVSYLRGMKDDDVVALEAAGISTITDLATSVSFDLTIALREIMPICDYIALAKQVVATCSVSADVYEGQEYANQQVIQGENGDANADKAVATETEWDGCARVDAMVLDRVTKRKKWPDVKGIDQVQILCDVFDDAQESICRWTPPQHTDHAGTVLQRKVFVFGGLTIPDYFENDVWYRDKWRPKAQFTLVPPTKSSGTVFEFESDKLGCIFEYHVMNMVEMLVVRNWTRTLGRVDFLSWLDGGKYRFRVRALNPAGNVDSEFELGRSEYIWIYAPKLPWALIIGVSSAVLVLLIGFFMEWRKRAAMERYAMKRMRRKLKDKKSQEGDANWRETYDNAKDADAKEKKKKKKKGKVVEVKSSSAAVVAGKKVKKTKDGATKKEKKAKDGSNIAKKKDKDKKSAESSKKDETSADAKKKKATKDSKKGKKEPKKEKKRDTKAKESSKAKKDAKDAKTKKKKN